MKIKKERKNMEIKFASYARYFCLENLFPTAITMYQP